VGKQRKDILEAMGHGKRTMSDVNNQEKGFGNVMGDAVSRRRTARFGDFMKKREGYCNRVDGLP
jgi:hypothetical protein